MCSEGGRCSRAPIHWIPDGCLGVPREWKPQYFAWSRVGSDQVGNSCQAQPFNSALPCGSCPRHGRHRHGDEAVACCRLHCNIRMNFTQGICHLRGALCNGQEPVPQSLQIAQASHAPMNSNRQWGEPCRKTGQSLKENMEPCTDSPLRCMGLPSPQQSSPSAHRP